MADIFEEGTTGYITLAFTDEDDAAVTPDSATYTLYNEKDKAIINSQDQTVIGALASSVDLELVPADNVIIDDDECTEAHILFVEWVYNTTKLGKDEHRYFVRNLTKVT